MVKINYIIFGYRKLTIDPQDLSTVTSIFIRSSIPSSINNDGTITVRERDFEKIKGILSGRIDFSHSEPLGLYGRWIRLEHKGAIISACVISFLIALFLSSVVWDVRVSGNETLTADEIIGTLSDCGFKVGSFWVATDRSKLESDCLSVNGKIAWININRRGTVAYVRIIESKSGPDIIEPPKVGYSNIMASSDCVIEEITVKSGTAVVKAGDVVKKGDLLVAGVLPSESGGGFCYAEASILGRVSDTLTVEMDRNYDKKLYIGRKTYSITINFFDFSINIFKRYGNLTNECDIIEYEISYTHLDKYKLPFYLTVKYIPLFTEEVAEYTDEEIVKLASDRLNAMTTERLSSSDLLKIKTSGEFTDSGYVIRSELVFLSEVGENIGFIAD